MIFIPLVAVPALAGALPPVQRVRLMSRVGRRFDPMGWACLGLLILTGLVNLIKTGMPIEAIFTSRYGLILGLKLLLVLLILHFQAIHSFNIGPAMERAAQQADEQANVMPPDLGRLARRSAVFSGIMLVATLLILFLAVLLSHAGG